MFEFLTELRNDPIKFFAGMGESAGRYLGFGSVYDNMEKSANDRMKKISDDAYNQAIAQGMNPQQALNAANKAIENANTLGTAVGVMRDGVHGAVADSSKEQLKGLTPLLIGAGVLGGGYILVSAFTGGSSSPPATPRSSRRNRGLD